MARSINIDILALLGCSAGRNPGCTAQSSAIHRPPQGPGRRRARAIRHRCRRHRRSNEEPTGLYAAAAGVGYQPCIAIYVLHPHSLSLICPSLAPRCTFLPSCPSSARLRLLHTHRTRGSSRWQSCFLQMPLPPKPPTQHTTAINSQHSHISTTRASPPPLSRTHARALPLSLFLRPPFRLSSLLLLPLYYLASALLPPLHSSTATSTPTNSSDPHTRAQATSPQVAREAGTLAHQACGACAAPAPRSHT